MAVTPRTCYYGMCSSAMRLLVPDWCLHALDNVTIIGLRALASVRKTKDISEFSRPNLDPLNKGGDDFRFGGMHEPKTSLANRQAKTRRVPRERKLRFVRQGAELRRWNAMPGCCFESRGDAK